MGVSISIEIKINLISKREIVIDQHSLGISSMYMDVKCIHEPWTFIKDKLSYDKNGNVLQTKVQIIRPALLNFEYKHPSHAAVQITQEHFSQEQLINFVGHVDISACGVAYSQTEVIEACAGAVEHCRQKNFYVEKDHLFHQPNRINQRMEKLISRGWVHIPF